MESENNKKIIERFKPFIQYDCQCILYNLDNYEDVDVLYVSLKPIYTYNEKFYKLKYYYDTLTYENFNLIVKEMKNIIIEYIEEYSKYKVLNIDFDDIFCKFEMKVKKNY